MTGRSRSGSTTPADLPASTGTAGMRVGILTLRRRDRRRRHALSRSLLVAFIAVAAITRACTAPASSTVDVSAVPQGVLDAVLADAAARAASPRRSIIEATAVTWPNPRPWLSAAQDDVAGDDGARLPGHR